MYLNIKGNMIGDDGIIALSKSLYNNQSLKVLDISLNEIGPSGFKALCEVIPDCIISDIICSKNFLGDEVIVYFANILADPNSSKHL